MEAMNRHPLVQVVRREAERISKNPAYRFLLFGGPLAGIFLLFFIFHSGVARELPVALVDCDNSLLSVRIENAINASPDVEVRVVTPNVFRAKELLEEGDVAAIVVLPDNLEKHVFQGVKAEVPVYINGTNVTVAGAVQRSLLTTLQTVSAGIQLKKLELAGNNRQQAMARVLPVGIQKHVLFNPYTNYGYFLNSALLYFMLFLFAFMSSVYTFGNELKRGTGAGLLEASGGSVRLAVLGKMFPYTVIFTGFAMLIAYLLFAVEGMPLKGSFLLLFVGQFVGIVAYQMLGLMFVAITKNLRLSLSVGSAYIMMGITFSGLTFPVEGMLPFVKTLTAFFPFTWWVRLLISQSLRGAPIYEALPYLCYIMLFFVAGVASMSVYKKGLSNPKYWGKL